MCAFRSLGLGPGGHAFASAYLPSPLCIDLDASARAQNSTNIFAKNVTCRGGTGVAFGSVGQYYQFVRRPSLLSPSFFPSSLPSGVFVIALVPRPSEADGNNGNGQPDYVDNVILEDITVSSLQSAPQIQISSWLRACAASHS